MFLIGFMASGKSTVGKLLARRLRRPFIDTDALVARDAGMTIPGIFHRKGEPFFRALESRVLQRISSGPARVVAVGAGAVLDARNVAAMRRAGIVVWLRVPFAEASRRIQRQGIRRRPLAAGPPGGTAASRRRTIRSLFVRRLPLYREAADLVVAARGNPQAIAARIERHVRPHPSPPPSRGRA